MKIKAKILIVFSVICVNAYSQKDTTLKKINNRLNGIINRYDIQLNIKTAPFYPIPYFTDHIQIVALAAEICGLKRHSIQFTGTTSYNSFGIIPEYKFFLSKRKQYTGFYTSIYAQNDDRKYIEETGNKLTPTYTYLEYYQTIYGVGAAIGYQNYLWKRVVIDLVMGYGTYQSTNTQVIKVVNTQLGNQNKTFNESRVVLSVGWIVYGKSYGHKKTK